MHILENGNGDIEKKGRVTMQEIKNEWLTVKVNEVGAELKSVEDNETKEEYMWFASPEHWNRTSPVLFPMVGRCKDKKYTQNGKEYPMSIHGFALNETFEVTQKTSNSVTLSLTENERTREVFPFAFCFQVTFTLSGRKVIVTYQVENRSSETMPFMLGAHPGFNVPRSYDYKKQRSSVEQRSDYFVCFEGKKEIKSRLVNLSTGLATDVVNTIPLENGYLRIADDLFKNDALVMEKQDIRAVSICGPDLRPFVTVRMDAPVYLLWSANDSSPYVCIEPWYGRCDWDGEKAIPEMKDKDYVNLLTAGDSFSTQCEMEFK